MTNAERIEDRAAKANAMVSALCKPRNTDGARCWTMSIPARPDHDPDLVIASSLADIPALLADNARLRAALEEVGIMAAELKAGTGISLAIALRAMLDLARVALQDPRP